MDHLKLCEICNLNVEIKQWDAHVWKYHGQCEHNLNPKECARCTRSDLVVSPAGGVQSRLDSRPSLLPPRAIRMVSLILGIKARQYGEWNWKKINNADNLDHVLNHAILHVQGDRSEFHPANMACRSLFYLDTLIEQGHDYDLSYLGEIPSDLGPIRVKE